MNWTIFPRTPSGIWLEAKNQMLSLPANLFWTYPLLMTSLIVSLWYMIIQAKLVLTLLNVPTLMPKLFAVTRDSRCRYGWVHISPVSMKQTVGYWLSLKQYIGLILYPNLFFFMHRNVFGDLFNFLSFFFFFLFWLSVTNRTMFTFQLQVFAKCLFWYEHDKSIFIHSLV